MDVVLIIAKILIILVSIAVIAVVLFQDSSSEGLSGTISGGNSDSFFGQNKEKSTKAKLTKLTVILGAAFAVLVIAVDVIIALA